MHNFRIELFSFYNPYKKSLSITGYSLICNKHTFFSQYFTLKNVLIDGECENIHNTLECDKWARTDECSLNPDWMIPNCRKCCKKCEGDDGGGGAQGIVCLSLFVVIF
ncbi:hypothetical protein DPMN_132819 [Dreissena polymorpha]|uniref:ShKT domain-containing protein n=1 Tax=Dreissena polymorpha TaxID=45954 RepID=A0A9D4JE71_DREPO|nr:hypothetical protein DPMN_132819 [Dreissena polymorpha]